MSQTSEPLERLRGANPVPREELVRCRPDPVLLRQITLLEPAALRQVGAPGLRRRRLGARVVPAVLATSLLGGAAAYALLRDGVSKPQTVACYERADPEARAAVVVVDERGPLAACADMWRRGGFDGGSEVPALALCALDSGVAGVFPTTTGEDVCARLNLPAVEPPAPQQQPQGEVNDRVLAFRDAVFAQFVGTSCIEPTVGASVVRRELERVGLGDWTIRGGEGRAGDGFSAERPCATLSLRPEIREVVLVPSPPRR